MPAAPAPAAPPKTFSGRLAATLTVAFTTLGTALAGLSTGQMEQAMYWRSLAAQDQARASSQWALAGFKRTRAVAVGGSARAVRAAGGRLAVSTPLRVRGPAEDVLKALPPAAAAPLRAELDAVLALPGTAPLLATTAGGPVPPLDAPRVEPAGLVELLAALKARKPDAELDALAAALDRAPVDEACRAAELAGDRYDADLATFVDAQVRLDRFVKALAAAARELVTDPAAPPPAARTAEALMASLHAGIDAADEQIYDYEAKLNFHLGNLYEARTRVSGVIAARYRTKSLLLFYSLVGLQAGTVIATVGGNRALVLVLAGALIGLAGLGLGGYAYLTPNPTFLSRV